MRRILQLPQIGGRHGRWGNMLQWYALGRWFCEKYDAVLQTADWPGEQVFYLNDPKIEGESNLRLSWPLAPDQEFWDGIALLNTWEYSFVPQYTDEQFRRWLPFRPEFAKPSNRYEAVAHMRRGDFLTNKTGWPIVQEARIREAAKAAGHPDIELVTDDAPHRNCGHPWKLDFLEDFLILATAPVMFAYPASSFSGCAARFNRGKVFVPMDYHNGPTDCRWELRKET
jgi:hypothetical protein